MSREAMKLALEALALRFSEGWHEGIKIDASDIMLLNDAAQALAEQPAQQEPAGWRPATFHRDNLTFNPGLPDEQTVKFWKLQGVEIEYCYTTPQPAQRKPLTDEEIQEAVTKACRECKLSWLGFHEDEQGHYTIPALSPSNFQFARAIEAAHGIKENT